MRVFLAKALTGLLVVGSVLALAACGSSKSSSSSSSSSASSGSSASGSSGGGTIDIYSDLPLTGAVTAQTVPALNGEKLALKQAGDKAGQWKVNFISLNDATATSPTNYDLPTCAAKRP